MEYVYELSHYYELENGDDLVTDIAVYSTLQKAEAARERLKNHPKFKDHPDGFCISEYKLNEMFWTEGFVPFGEQYSPTGFEKTYSNCRRMK